MNQKTIKTALLLIGVVFLVEGIALGWIGFGFTQAIESQLEQAVFAEEIFETSAAETASVMQPFQLMFQVIAGYSAVKALIGIGLIYLAAKKFSE